VLTPTAMFNLYLKLLLREEKHLAIFRMIKDANILNYRDPLVKVVSMLLRLVGLSRSRIRADKDIANLLLVGADSQKQESYRLYDLLLTLNGKKHHKRLSQSLHQLLNVLLCPQDIGDADIACPTDQLLFLASLTDNGYKTASVLKSLCCKMQFCFRIIYFHTVRMEAYQLPTYEPFKPEQGSEKSIIEAKSMLIFDLDAQISQFNEFTKAKLVLRTMKGMTKRMMITAKKKMMTIMTTMIAVMKMMMKMKMKMMKKMMMMSSMRKNSKLPSKMVISIHL
jgi:hypothetical protein